METEPPKFIAFIAWPPMKSSIFISVTRSKCCSAKRVLIGTDLEADMVPQVVVPHGVWQGARLVAGGEFALLGCTVSPGFEYADYESGKRNLLAEAYPQQRDLICVLTRS